MTITQAFPEATQARAAGSSEWEWVNITDGKIGIQEAVFGGRDTDPEFDNLLNNLWQRGAVIRAK